MSSLRLAQSYDIQGAWDIAKDKHQELMKESTIPEIRDYLESGLSIPFQIPKLDNKLLLRQYNLSLNKYRARHDNKQHY